MTAQRPEVLLHCGKQLDMHSLPLWHFPNPPTSCVFHAPSTALWRGYIGTWAIQNSRLYLIKLKAWVKIGDTMTEVGLEALFPNSHDGVFADWFTGVLRCPSGAVVKQECGVHECTFEKDLFLRMERGVFLEEWEVVNGVAQAESEPGCKIEAIVDLPYARQDSIDWSD